MAYGSFMRDENQPRSGLPYALGAYGIWGFLPVYLLLIRTVPALEFVSWRILFTLPVCLVFLMMRKQMASLWQTMRSPQALGALALSSTLIGVNWLVYIIAIQQDEVYAASLGYYINPLVNVLIGAFFLKEHITRRQWIAVALATIGVGMLFSGALTTLWISLTLAVTFGFYGLVRKLAPIAALPGLTVETLILSLPAMGVVIWQAQSAQGSALASSTEIAVLLSLAGLITAIPLLMFATAARLMDYSLLGFVQFLAPTITFFVGLFIFREPLDSTQLTSFICIWCAIIIFSWDLMSRKRKYQRQPAKRSGSPSG